MKQEQVVKAPVKPRDRGTGVDLRTPSGRLLRF
jgi:hypothetical protein